MKRILLTSIIIIIFIGLHAQSSSCAKFKNGVFKSTFNGITIIVKRAGSNQIEHAVNSKDTVSFVVKWIDDCSYTLTPTKDDLIKYPKMPKNTVLTVKMVSKSESSYTQTTTTNFSNQIITSEMIKLSDN
jgi:hypothetical protein